MRKLVLIALAAGAGAWAFAGRRGEILRGRIRGFISNLRTKDYDDATLKAKVESELFRHEHEVKGAVDVNAQEGVIQLRGELPSQGLIDTLVEQAQKIHGVREVENLLHTTGTEAPMHH